MKEKLGRTEQQWRDQLTPEQYRVAREKGTEPRFTGRYCDHHEEGTYRCIGCGLELFDSRSKYDSGSGWPSFFAPARSEHIAEQRDRSVGMERTEVLCAHCEAHLGHVFPDGPAPSGLRYCINSVALDFEPNAGE